MRDIRLLLDNIRSVHNVGSIFRTAETRGVSKIYCIGTTPQPVDRFGNKRKDLAKVALGAEDIIPFEYSQRPHAILRQLKKEGFQIIALEQSKNSTNYKNVKASNKCVVILGNEVDGVTSSLLDLADIIAEIPMSGRKESLNVSVASGIALFTFFE